jgi:Ca2+-binding EF-hand superfamily protein
VRTVLHSFLHMEHLTQSALEQLSVVFRVFSRPQGTSSHEEGLGAEQLTHLLTALRPSSSRTAALTAAALLSRYAPSGSVFLDFPSFAQAMASEPFGEEASPTVHAEVELELARLFAGADVDGDGLLSVEEVAALCDSAGAQREARGEGTATTREDAEAVLEEAAGPGAQQMNLSEFLALAQTAL